MGLQKYKKKCIFAAGLVTLTKGAKREAGASPAQSRCCKLQRTESPILTSLCAAISTWEDRADGEQARIPAKP